MPPGLRTCRAWENGRRADNVDDLGRRWKKGEKHAHDGIFDFFGPSTEQFAGAILFESLQSLRICSVDVLVDGLHKFFLQFFELRILLCPFPSSCRSVRREDFLVEFDKRIDGIGGELEGDFVLRNHVHMYAISFDMDELVIE